MSFDLQTYRAVMKNDLLAFLEGAFPVVDRRKALEIAPYMEYLVSEHGCSGLQLDVRSIIV